MLMNYLLYNFRHDQVIETYFKNSNFVLEYYSMDKFIENEVYDFIYNNYSLFELLHY